jgi:hypothetical protein
LLVIKAQRETRESLATMGVPKVRAMAAFPSDDDDQQADRYAVIRSAVIRFAAVL